MVADGAGGWFVAGVFKCVGGVPTRGLVHLLSDGTLDRAWKPALPRSPDAGTGYAPAESLALLAGALFVGGKFGIEALDATTGALKWRAPVKGGRHIVFGLAATPGILYVGGEFATVDGKPRRAIAALDPANGHLLDWHAAALANPTARYPYGPASVYPMALNGSHLFIAGGFTSVGGQPRPGFASLDAATGSVSNWRPTTLPCCPNAPAVGDIETVVAAGDHLLTAGHDGFGSTNASTGAVESWTKQVRGVARQFATYGDLVYLAGDCRNHFDAVGGKRRHNLAALNLTTMTFTDWAPNLPRYVCVSALAANANQVLVGGFIGKRLD